MPIPFRPQPNHPSFKNNNNHNGNKNSLRNQVAYSLTCGVHDAYKEIGLKCNKPGQEKAADTCSVRPCSMPLDLGKLTTEQKSTLLLASSSLSLRWRARQG